ncbi:hypothetical protein POVCU1_014020, partial [Plasmodium ovale curtisi]
LTKLRTANGGKKEKRGSCKYANVKMKYKAKKREENEMQNEGAETAATITKNLVAKWGT